MSDVPIYNFLLFKIFNSSAFSLKISLTVSVIPLDVLQFFSLFLTLNYFVVLLTSVWKVWPAEEMIMHTAFIPTSPHFNWRSRRDLVLRALGLMLGF